MTITRPVAVVGLGVVLPDAEDVKTFWENLKSGKYSIGEVPPDRWRIDLYYDPDPKAPDKTYSKIGAFVRNFHFEPYKWGIAIPPRVIEQMDQTQQWAISAARQALSDYGYPQRPLDPQRVAVILGNALGGERHYQSSMRIRAAEYQAALVAVPEFQSLPLSVQEAILDGVRKQIRSVVPDITEDTMPGELGNIIAGRVANVFNFQGPNFITDAACASSLAAIQAAIDGLNNGQFDAVLTGGVDRSMSIEGYVKFSKIGALSPDGSRPYADGANGFVQGEGAALFLLKRLEDAEKDGDHIYAVIRGVGSSSDGKGKGITAPNPTGQQQAIERAWKNSGVSPATVSMIEGHGTSTRVGDVVEVNSLTAIFGQFDLKPGSVALGSVKSNIGHLKSAAGAAGLMKTVLALHHKQIPPTLNVERPNPNIDFAHIPFYPNTVLRDWEIKQGEVRRAGVSSFGFGGTNFHLVVDEYVPGILQGEKKIYSGVDLTSRAEVLSVQAASTEESLPKPYRGLYFASAETVEGLKNELQKALQLAQSGNLPESRIPSVEELERKERMAIDYNDRDEFIKRAERALKGFESAPESNPWQALVAHGVFRGSGKPGKLAFLFPGQGSQYVNMLKDLCEEEPVAAQTFAEADRIMTPILGKPLTEYIYVAGDEASLAEAEKALRNTEITQPAMLTANVAMMRLLNKFGFTPDMVIGHSLGEYAALVAAGVLTFAEALEVVSARGREMKRVAMEDNGAMAAISAPIEKVAEILKTIPEYVVIANINSPLQCVIGGTTKGVDLALEAFQQAGFQGTKIPVSHAFHTKIVAPASQPLREVIARMNIQPPRLTIAANVTGGVYPNTRDEILDLLAAQVASPVQFIKGIETLYREGARVFIEVGPKRVLNALAMDILKGKTDVTILATNHPREGSVVSFNKALCGLLAAGVVPKGTQHEQSTFSLVSSCVESRTVEILEPQPQANLLGLESKDREEIKQFVLNLVSEKTGYPVEMLDLELDLEADLGIDTVKQAELFAAIRTHYNIPRREDLRLSDYNTLAKVIDFMANALANVSEIQKLPAPIPVGAVKQTESLVSVSRINASGVIQKETNQMSSNGNGKLPLTGSVVVSGAGLGLPGKNRHVFDDSNIASILRGEIRIEPLSEDLRRRMAEKRAIRLVKSEAGAIQEVIDHVDQTVKLGGQRGKFDLIEEFGVPADRVEATDISTQLAIAAGIEALRDAGIPLVMAYRRTSKGTYLPDRWKLPEALADETGVIFASAFPGLDRMAEETQRFYEVQNLESQIQQLRSLQRLISPDTEVYREIQRRADEIDEKIRALDYHFDRRFVFRVLSMGHSQFAEYIGARGPNTHVNAACATTTHAIAIAEDWIRAGRARRVVIIAGDDVTSGALSEWIGTSLMASGAATVEGDPRKAILPFDRRRNGMIMGMGAAALVIESEDAVRERGMYGIAEILATQIANSAYHGTRLDVEHVALVMERLIQQAEERFGIRRGEIAGQTVFVSHETYTPARGGSASAEIRALRQVFGVHAPQVIIANTKGFTGHSMGVGIEDVVAVKSLETGIVPPIANIHDGFEPDPELGDLNLSKGVQYNPVYALRLGAGFGSQIAMVLLRKIPVAVRVEKERYINWLREVSGYDQVTLEVEHRTLRIRHDGPPKQVPRKSNWEYGYGPTMWAVSPQSTQEILLPSQSPVEFSEVAPAQEMSEAQVSESATLSAVPVNIAGVDEEAIKQFVLQVVSEKTGYPQEMLDLDLDLEADLGIDTVKQAELFATIRTHYNIPRREDLRLADYNTLAKVIQFMKEALTTQSQQPVPGGQNEAGVRLENVAPLASSSVPDEDSIKQFVLSVVSEKTGYPVEMLDLDLDLEADLGIDTVKQAELFATIRTHYNIPRREDLRLSDYNTLAKVIDFMREALEAQINVASGETTELTHSETEGFPQPYEAWQVMEPMEQEPLSSDERLLEEDLSEEGKVKVRIPVPVLVPHPSLCVPSGISLDQQARVLIVDGEGGVGESLEKLLNQKGVQAHRFKPESVRQMAEEVQKFVSQGEIQGVYFLPALDSRFSMKEFDPRGWQASVELHADGLFTLIRTLNGQPFVVCATRMGGLHGVENPHKDGAFGGLVSGFAKALSMERPNCLVKVVDFERKATSEWIAERLLEETLYDASTCEVGWKDNQRFTFVLKDVETLSLRNLEGVQTFVVTGASGGIVGPILLDLAKFTRGTFYLLSRTSLPDPSDPDLQALAQDRNAFRKALAERLHQQGERATPSAVEQRIAVLERGAATLKVVEKMKALGARVHYLPCDVTRFEAVEEAVEQILKEVPQIDVVLHAAGMEKSRKVETKPFEEFAQIVSVKVNGFYHLFKALENRRSLPKQVVFFSSVAGRFGNAGQTDYSAANDFLSKLANTLSQEYPQTNFLSIDWGAWAEVGMASRGFLPDLMKRAGIEMLSPKSAAPQVRYLISQGIKGEVVVAGSLGMLESQRLEQRMLNIEQINQLLADPTLKHFLYERVVDFNLKDGLTFEVELEPNQHPFLQDHALNGIPLLPGVMGIEGLAIVSQRTAMLFSNLQKSYRVTSLSDIHFHLPLKFYRNQARKLIWKVLLKYQAGQLIGDVRLESTIQRYGKEPESMVHFTAQVFLVPDGVKRSDMKSNPPYWNGSQQLSAEEVYRLYFHGPSFQVVEGVQRKENQVIGKWKADLPPVTDSMTEWATLPMLVELCLQTAGVWEIGKTGVLALPRSIEWLEIYRTSLPKQPVLYAEVEPVPSENHSMAFDARVVDAKGRVYLELKGYRTEALPYPVEQELLSSLTQWAQLPEA
nr:SDR family NAD(P)-dependent oxidoreductase [Anaerolinea sp.]